jgi:hypothetical protein
LEFTTLIGLQVFFLVTVGLALRHGNILFLDRHGWSHRLAGAIHLSWLVYGCFCVPDQTQDARQAFVFLYDIVLGITGMTCQRRWTDGCPGRSAPFRTVTFKIAPGQSGTLSRKAMVTQGEMLEHAFYQFLNLWQALFLHLIAYAWNQNHQWPHRLAAMDRSWVCDSSLVCAQSLSSQFL